MGPPKRPSEELQHPRKLPKIEHGLVGSPLNETHSQHGDFSGSVKKRLANSSRTGQACDRCKVRQQKAATASRSIMVSHWQSELRTSLATRLGIGFQFFAQPLLSQRALTANPLPGQKDPL